MIKNRNLHKFARKRTIGPFSVDISTDSANLSSVFVHPDCDAKITDVQVVYTVATNDGTHREIRLGISTDADQYLAFTTTDDQSAATVASGTVLNSGTLLPAGTPLQFSTATGAATNTGEVEVVRPLRARRQG